MKATFDSKLYGRPVTNFIYRPVIYKFNFVSWLTISNCAAYTAGIYQGIEVNIICSFSLQIDFLVNNAGIVQIGSSWESDLDVDLSVMNINVLGTISLTKAVLPHMVQSKNGQIVVLSSASGKCGKLNLFWMGSRCRVDQNLAIIK